MSLSILRMHLSVSATSSIGIGSRDLAGQGDEGGDLLGDGQRLKLGLLEDLPDPPPALENGARCFVQPGAETGEGLKLFELGVGQSQVAGDGPVSRELGLAADAGYRFADIDRGQDALFGRAAAKGISGRR